MDFSLATLLTFVAASIAIVIVPGPNVTVIVANSLRSGTRAGLATVAGTQFGVMLLIFVLAAGLSTIMENFAALFNFIRIAGACYLVYLGIRMWRSDGNLDGNLDTGAQPSDKGKSHFWQGCLVLLANPKALFFFGAFIPQFIDPTANAPLQTVVFGVIFLLTATVFDSGYAILAGQSSRWLTRKRVRATEITAGTCLIGGGIWLALMKRS
jgi:homoserine/homoserine lactone efflux protein